MQYQNQQAQLQDLNAQYTGQSEFHKVQRNQEEKFVKSNLDYENRLRGHMYQFDEANDRARINDVAIPGQGSGNSLQQKVVGDQPT